jgi:hypothetical protein
VKLLKISLILNLIFVVLLIWFIPQRGLYFEVKRSPDSDWHVIKSYLSSAYEWDESNYIEKQMSVLSLLDSDFRSQRLSEMETEFEKIKLNQAQQKIRIMRAVHDKKSEQYFVLMNSTIIEQKIERQVVWVAAIELKESRSAFQWEISKLTVQDLKGEMFNKNWIIPNQYTEILVTCNVQFVNQSVDNSIRYFLDFDQVSKIKLSVINSQINHLKVSIMCKDKNLPIQLDLNDRYHTLFIHGNDLKWTRNSISYPYDAQNRENLKSLVKKHFGIEEIKRK